MTSHQPTPGTSQSATAIRLDQSHTYALPSDETQDIPAGRVPKGASPVEPRYEGGQAATPSESSGDTADIDSAENEAP